MKRLSPAKLRVIIALNFVAIALLIGLFFFNPKDSGTPVSGEPEVHERIRAAQISLNPSLSWELPLCGSGDESAVGVFLHGGYIYIFGNTTSSDLDFDRSGIFLAVADTYGVTKTFLVYGEDGDILRSVCLCEGGFLLAVETRAAPKLLVVDFTGMLKKTVSGFFHGFESVLNVKYYSGGYLLFSQAQNSLTGVRSLRCSFFTPDITFAASSTAVSPYSLDLFDSAVISGRVVALCNASSTLHTVPGMVEFTVNDSPKIRLFAEYPGKISGFSVYEGDFLLLTTQDGSSLLRITTAYNVREKTTLSQLKALGFTEVGAEKNGVQLYLAFVDTAVYITGGDGSRKNTLAAFIPTSRAYLGQMVFYCGYIAESVGTDGTGGTGGAGGSETEKTVGVNIYNNEKILLSAKIGGGSNPLLVLDENNLLCVYQSGGDIIICKLRYPLFV